MRKMLTIFSRAENVHVIKDVDMIPYRRHQKFHYEATLARDKNDDYTYLKIDFKGLQLLLIAKIFVLASRYEGLPIVFPEAAKFGCYLISTELPAARDLTNQGAYRSIFPIDDYAALSQILLTVCGNNNHLESKARAMQAFAYQNCYWPTICRNLDQWLWK